MLNSNKGQKSRKLSGEILGLFGVTVAISVFFYLFLSITADSIVQTYLYENDLVFSEIQEWTVGNWIQSISLAATVFLFVVLFLFLVGQKLTYLNEIIRGIDMLRMHRMDFEIPVEGENELTELAESINFLAKTEKGLKEKEQQIQEEKEALLRALSHDIRTPLTSILAYSEYMEEQDELGQKEMKEYISMIQQKAVQIKGLTDLLLDSGQRNLEVFEDGRFLMQQLAEEWETVLEERFRCITNLEGCDSFSAEYDIQELRRIFDNLLSNVEKYADSQKAVELNIYTQEDYLIINQRNTTAMNQKNTESYKIGIESIKHIARKYEGRAEVSQSEEEFAITIYLKFRILQN